MRKPTSATGEGDDPTGAEPAARDRSLASGCSSLVLLPMFLLGGILAIVLVFVVMLGIDVLAGWITGLLMTPPLPALIGAGTVVFAGWGLLRLATGHAPPGTSRGRMIIAVLTLMIVAACGVVFVIVGVSPQASDSPGF